MIQPHLPVSQPECLADTQSSLNSFCWGTRISIHRLKPSGPNILAKTPCLAERARSWHHHKFSQSSHLGWDTAISFIIAIDHNIDILSSCLFQPIEIDNSPNTPVWCEGERKESESFRNLHNYLWNMSCLWETGVCQAWRAQDTRVQYTHVPVLW